MPQLTDAIRYAIVKEVSTGGGTPTAPAWEVLRLVSESIRYAPNIIESGELNNSRGLSDSLLVSTATEGTITTYAAFNDVFIEMVNAVIGQGVTWPPAGTVTPLHYQDDTRTTFSFEKSLPNSAARYTYERWDFLTVSRLEVSMAPNEPVMFNWDLVGGEMNISEDASVKGDAEFPSSTYTAVSPSVAAAPPMTGEDVTITWITSGSTTPGVSLAASEVISMTLNIDSQNKVIDELGTGRPTPLLGKMMAKLNCVATFQDEAVLEAQRDRTDISCQVVLSNSGGAYTFQFPRVKIDTADVMAEAADEVLMVNLEMTGLVEVATGEMVGFGAV